MTPLDSVNDPYPPSPDGLLSALADGELANADLQNVLAPYTVHSDWNAYQVIGQVLKGYPDSAMPESADPAFLQRLNLRLANEKIAPAALPAVRQGLVAEPNQPAANDTVSRWKLLAGFASLSLVMVVIGRYVDLPGTPTAAQIVVSSPQGPIVRDARLEELITAHKQLGSSSLQAPSGFLRQAGFDNPQSELR